jgi:hypothetical protein
LQRKSVRSPSHSVGRIAGAYNSYCPSETTVVATATEVSPTERVTIGRQLMNRRYPRLTMQGRPRSLVQADVSMNAPRLTANIYQLPLFETLVRRAIFKGAARQ